PGSAITKLQSSILKARLCHHKTAIANSQSPALPSQNCNRQFSKPGSAITKLQSPILKARLCHHKTAIANSLSFQQRYRYVS
uniref:Ovule protein n=1 Tax=Macrostomum lignano TaxID=282301 RepID=A0A1I8FWS2_9PLAT